MDSIINYDEDNKTIHFAASTSTTLIDDSTCPPPNKRATTTVSFANGMNNEIYEIPHINDYSSEMIDSIWYNNADYQRISISCSKIIIKLNESIDSTAAAAAAADSKEPTTTSIEKRVKKYCSRGLEKFTDARVLTRRTIQHNAIGAVLDEQARQRMNTNDDAMILPVPTLAAVDIIAEIYARHCLHCKYHAIATAKRDELESSVYCKAKIDASAILEVHDTSPPLRTTKLQRNTKASSQA
jgi:hypothetical protein